MNTPDCRTSAPALKTWFVGRLPSSLERLSPRVVVAQTGRAYGDTVIAVAGSSGLAVIDTGIAPSLTRRYRGQIEEAFGRKDFAWVVNTHQHYDHTHGNGVFPEARVVGHELTREGVERSAEGRATLVADERRQVATWKERLAAGDPTAEAAARDREAIFLYSTMCDDLEKGGLALLAPSVTFSDRLTLHLGDLTVRLFYFGAGIHSGDGIVAWVPEEGLVATGDLLSGPLILAVESMESDVERQVAVFDEILRDLSKVRRVITTHHGSIRPEELVARRDYLAALLDELGKASQAGLSLAEASRRVDVEGERFASARALGLPPQVLANLHRQAVRNVWFHLRGGRPAAQEIDRAIAAGGVAAAWKRFEELLPQRDDHYDFSEPDFNALGYRRLTGGDRDAAQAVFEMNVRLFPGSWNVHDSLAEALAVKGDCRRAIESYEASLEINAQNANATEQVARLRRECPAPTGR